MSKYENLIKVVKIINKISHNAAIINVKTLEHLGEIAPEVSNNLDLLKGWFKGETIYVEEVPDETTSKPLINIDEEPYKRFDADAEWRSISEPQLWCSSSGLIYSVEKDELLTPKYHNGDYMVLIDENDQETGKKRAGVLMARAFRIQSENKTSDNWVLEYRNGDRKDIRPENIYWRLYETYNLQTRAVEDVCRRIIEYDGDIEKIYENYDEGDRFITKQFIKSILDKKQFATISDKFFVRSLSGKIVVRQQKEDKPMGADIGEFLRKTGDINIAKQLLMDKIKNDKNALTVDEEAMMVILAVIEGKVTNNKGISKYIRDTFKHTIPFDTIDEWKDAKDSQLYKIIGG